MKGCGIRLLGRSASESSRLRQGAAAHPGDSRLILGVHRVRSRVARVHVSMVTTVTATQFGSRVRHSRVDWQRKWQHPSERSETTDHGTASERLEPIYTCSNPVSN